MTDLLNDCLKLTNRKYPDGYGFSIVGIQKELDPDDFRFILKTAWFCARLMADLGSQDVTDFVRYYAESRINNRGWRWFLIEAIQLIHQAALVGSPKAEHALKILKHSSFRD